MSKVINFEKKRFVDDFAHFIIDDLFRLPNLSLLQCSSFGLNIGL